MCIVDDGRGRAIVLAWATGDGDAEALLAISAARGARSLKRLLAPRGQQKRKRCLWWSYPTAENWALYSWHCVLGGGRVFYPA
jgi:hypothetical protein